jgi:hypothetical protein
MKSEKLVCTREWCNEWYLHQQPQQQQKHIMWVGRKRKKETKNIACKKNLQGKVGHEKRCFTLECTQDTSTVERPGTSMLA